MIEKILRLTIEEYANYKANQQCDQNGQLL